MYTISSLEEAKTVILEIQMNSAGSEFELLFFRYRIKGQPEEGLHMAN